MPQYKAENIEPITSYCLTIRTETDQCRDGYCADRFAIIKVANRKVIDWRLKGSFSSSELKAISEAIFYTLVKEGLIDKS